MKTSIIILLVIACGLIACEGDRGPTGPTGKDYQIIVGTGVLSNSQLNEDGFFEISYPHPYEMDFLVEVKLRKTSGHTWYEPTWEIQMGPVYRVFIKDDDYVAPGFEYMITVLY